MKASNTLKDFIRKYGTLFLLVIVATPVIVYLLVAIPFPPAFGMGRDAWLGYYGSFFGGLFGGIATMYAVFNTLKHNKEREEESNRLSIIPYINVKIEVEEYEEHEEEKFYNFVFENVGLGTAIELNINSELELFDTYLKKRSYNYKKLRTLPLNEEIKILTDNSYNKPFNTLETFTIEYWDVIRTHKYKQTVELFYTFPGVIINSISKQELLIN